MSSLGLDASELVLEVGDEGGSKVPDTVDQELHPTVSLALDGSLQDAVSRLLDLPSPKLNARMVTFLCKEHGMMAFVRFITRAKESDMKNLKPWEAFAKDVEVPPSYFTANKVKLTQSRRAFADAEDLHRAYIAMKLLSEIDGVSSRRVAGATAPIIVRELFRCFCLDAKGSFHHVYQVMEALLRAFPSSVVAGMCGDADECLEWGITQLLNNLHRPRMSDLLTDLVKLAASPLPQPATMYSYGGQRANTQAAVGQKDKSRWYKSLAKVNFLERLVIHICSAEYSVDHRTAAADCMSSLLEPLCREPEAEVLLRSIGASKSLLADLVKNGFATREDPAVATPSGVGAGGASGAGATTSTSPSERPITQGQELCISVLHSVVAMAFRPTLSVAASTPAMAGAPPQQVRNMLSSVAGLVYARLFSQCNVMCDWMVDVNDRYHRRFGTVVEATKGVAKMGNAPKSKYNPAKSYAGRRYQGYSVRAPFGVGRLSASKLLVALVKRDAKNMLAKIPKEVWSVLTAWMLEYRHNNLFHILYMELWHELVMANHDSIEVVLPASRAVSAFVEHLSSGPNSSAKGPIIRMLNILRLKADSLPPTSWLRQYLKSHDQWRNFKSRLLDMTRQQVGRAFSVPRVSAPGAFAMAGMRFGPPSVNVEPAIDDNNVDLGSTYADSLGFASVTPNLEPEPAPTKRRRRKKKGKRRRAGQAGAGPEDDSASVASSTDGDSGTDDGSAPVGSILMPVVDGTDNAADDMCNVSSPTATATATVTASGGTADAPSADAGSGAGTGDAATTSQAEPREQQQEEESPQQQQVGAGGKKKKKRKKRKKKKKKDSSAGDAGSGNAASASMWTVGSASASAPSTSATSDDAASSGVDDDDDSDISEAMSELMSVE